MDSLVRVRVRLLGLDHDVHEGEVDHDAGRERHEVRDGRAELAWLGLGLAELAWGAPHGRYGTQGTYGTPEAGTRTSYVQWCHPGASCPAPSYSTQKAGTRSPYAARYRGIRVDTAELAHAQPAHAQPNSPMPIVRTVPPRGRRLVAAGAEGWSQKAVAPGVAYVSTQRLAHAQHGEEAAQALRGRGDAGEGHREGVVLPVGCVVRHETVSGARVDRVSGANSSRAPAKSRDGTAKSLLLSPPSSLCLHPTTWGASRARRPQITERPRARSELVRPRDGGRWHSRWPRRCRRFLRQARRA